MAQHPTLCCPPLRSSVPCNNRPRPLTKRVHGLYSTAVPIGTFDIRLHPPRIKQGRQGVRNRVMQRFFSSATASPVRAPSASPVQVAAG
jgi:hypothetical protein